MTADVYDVTTIRLPRVEAGVGSLGEAADAIAKLAAALTTTEQINAAAAETDTSASDAQREAGNYRKGKVTFHGLRVSVENPKGSVRSGVSKSGTRWSTVMQAHYGYVAGTDGADGDPVDCFVGPDASSTTVYVVNQVDPDTRRFDEHKAMLGYSSEEDARAGYLANYEKGWKGLGSIRVMSLGDFKRWLVDGDMSKRADELQKRILDGDDEQQRDDPGRLGGGATGAAPVAGGRDRVPGGAPA